MSKRMTFTNTACTPLEGNLRDYAGISGTPVSLGAARRRVHVPRISLLVPTKGPQAGCAMNTQSMSETR